MIKCWIPNSGFPISKPVGGLKVDSAFHPSVVDQISTRNSWGQSGKKQTVSLYWLWNLEAGEPYP